MRNEPWALALFITVAAGCATWKPASSLPELTQLPELKNGAFDRFEKDHPEFKSCHSKQAKVRTRAAASIEFLATVNDDGGIAQLELVKAESVPNPAPGCDVSMRGTIRNGGALSRLIYQYGWDGKGGADRSKYRESLVTVQGTPLPADDEIIASMDKRLKGAK